MSDGGGDADLDTVVAWLGDGATGRSRLLEWYAARRREDDPGAHGLLDRLAADIADPDILEVVLRIVAEHHLARPAIRRVLLDPHDVDDAEQATLASVALSRARYDGRSRFTTWLHQVALNEARMLVRARARRPATPSAAPPENGVSGRLSSLVANRDAIDQALAALPDDQRVVIELRELHDFDYDEIAARLELPVGTVRSRLHRGRAALAAAVAAAQPPLRETDCS